MPANSVATKASKSETHLTKIIKNVNNLGMCPSNSAAGRVQIPMGYTYNAATTKYYKPFKESKTWEGAQLQCNSDGATLIESRTKAEHEVLRWMYGEFGII